jgi:hypothetical protein
MSRAKEVKEMRKVFGVGFVAGLLSVGLAVPSFAAFDYTNTFTPIVTEISTGVAAIVVVSAVIIGVILGLKFGLGWLRRVVGR